MSVERLIANSLRIAREDLAGARLLAKANNRNAAYLCEQAAEKVIRAVLTSEGLHAGIGHALGKMVDSLPDQNLLKVELAQLAPLAAFATTYRYPTSVRVPAPPREAELDSHMKRVEAALARAAAQFGVDLDDPLAPARTPAPAR